MRRNIIFMCELFMTTTISTITKIALNNQNWQSEVRVWAAAWRQHLMILTSLMMEFWGSIFKCSTRFCQVRWGDRASSCRCSRSQTWSMGFRSGGIAGPYYTRPSDLWSRAATIPARCVGVLSSVNRKLGGCAGGIAGWMMASRKVCMEALKPLTAGLQLGGSCITVSECRGPSVLRSMNWEGPHDTTGFLYPQNVEIDAQLKKDCHFVFFWTWPHYLRCAIHGENTKWGVSITLIQLFPDPKNH